MSQADTDQEAPAATTEQPADQTASQPSAAEAPEPSASVDPSVSVLQRNFTHLTGGDPDFNKVIHMANQYQELDRDGYAALAERAGEFGQDANGQSVNGHWLIGQLSAGQQPQEPGALAPEQGFQEPDVDARIDQRVDQRMTQYSPEQTLAQDRRTEATSYDTELASAGFTRNPTSMDVDGSRKDVDVMYDNFMKPAVARRVSEMMASRVSKTDPNYLQKINAPATPEMVRAAVQWLAPHLQTYKQQSAEAVAEEQADIPPAGLTGDGASGRTQVDTSKMSDAQLKAHIIDAAVNDPEWKG